MREEAIVFSLKFGVDERASSETILLRITAGEIKFNKIALRIKNKVKPYAIGVRRHQCQFMPDSSPVHSAVGLSPTVDPAYPY